VGLVVLVQLLENYLSGRIFVDGTIDRELIATGWGMHNNVGCMMAMMMPFAFYLATKSKRGWFFNLLGTVLMLGTLLSCSRGSMLMAGLAYVLCAYLLLKDPDGRRKNLKIYLAALGVVAVTVAVLAPKLSGMFRLFITQLDNVSKRDSLVYYGVCQFLSEPVFGGSFFPQGSFVPWDWSNLETFSSFFPPRWHNTLVQMMASCGTMGITAYLLQRGRTVQLVWKRRSVEHTFLAMSLGVLLCAALLDCHFFNVGPVLFYSMALAFAEKLPEM
jgi:O-antigen ligase